MSYMVSLPCAPGDVIYKVVDDCGSPGECCRDKRCSGCESHLVYVEPTVFHLDMLNDDKSFKIKDVFVSEEDAHKRCAELLGQQKNNVDTTICRDIKDKLDKLAEYEKAELTGHMLLLKCRPDDHIYIVAINSRACRGCEYFVDNTDYGDTSYCAKDIGHVIEPEYPDWPICDKQFYEVRYIKVYSISDAISYTSCWGKSAFATESEALKKAEELNGNDSCFENELRDWCRKVIDVYELTDHKYVDTYSMIKAVYELIADV